MRVLIIYTLGEQLEPTRYSIEAEETEREGGEGGGTENVPFADLHFRKPEIFHHPAAACL